MWNGFRGKYVPSSWSLASASAWLNLVWLSPLIGINPSKFDFGSPKTSA